ncbi:MAG: DUF1642 domain-containing protein [Lactococcus sp.]|nr:DUF1642 domain-containing protein [Lactococcus sp.]MDN5402849.1 DUF1642 domain-containing protein [Lactococcus sp.]MDN5410090.1 DUF1642 domain-containing protein [Lactococcus sp.]MDN5411203.1 DUF1642 domain-containing protein [Lactococcus sp.]MDN5435801.1 DUF1642 domain-containing protein [Lactococcus sp.]MDN5460685.1 DUF1642 domain-containing protein [Lactococcus sp.]
MSEFEKELEKFNLENGTDYRTLNQYSDVLTTHFKDWQPPKPLVVVPQFVADWFEDGMGGTFSAVVASYSFGDDEAITWVHDNGGLDLLCKMKLYGYTVEKEQLYKVVFLKTGDDEILLLKSDTFFIDWISIYNDLKYQFTEKEIKDIDERYWAFAVPVEEVNP